MAPSPKSRTGRLLPERLALGAVLVWVVLVFSHYFSFPKALDLSFLKPAFLNLGRIDPGIGLSNWLGFLRNLFFALAIGFVLWRVGRRLFLWLGLKVENIPLRFSMEAALGVLFSGTGWLGLGLCGLWWESLLSVLGLALLGFSLWDFPRSYLKFQRFQKVEWPGWFYFFVGGGGLLFVGLSLANHFTPEVYYDGLVYHLATLQFWQFHHGIADFYTNLYSHYPFGAELYFANGFFLQGGETAKLLNLFTSVWCALAAAGWVAEEAGSAFGVLAWTMVLACPLVSAVVWTTQIDLFLSFFLLLFFYALGRWAREKESWKWVFAAGLFGGAALGVKYTAALGVLAGLLALAANQRDLLRFKYWSRWGLLKGFLLLGFAPWALKNFVFTGNPLYPYFSHLFGGSALSEGMMRGLLADHESPWTGGFSAVEWLGRILTRDLDKTTAPLLFSFLPFLWLPGKKRPAVKYLLTVGGLFLVLGFLVSHQPRLLIPALVPCWMGMALVLADLERPGWTRVWAWVVVVFAGLSLLSLGRLSLGYYESQKMWLGWETRQDYLRTSPQTRTYFELTEAVAQRVPSGDRLLVVGDARSLYYPRPLYANSAFDDPVLAQLARKEKDGEGIWRALRKLGVEGLAVCGEEGRRLAEQTQPYRLTEGEWKKVDDFIQRRTDLIYAEEGNGLYRLLPSPVERKKPIPNLVGLFNVQAVKPTDQATK